MSGRPGELLAEVVNLFPNLVGPKDDTYSSSILELCVFVLSGLPACTRNGFLKAMEQINTAVGADVGEGRFVTFVAAILRADSSEVELLSAGHAPLFLYCLKSDRFETMEAQGLPLGISPDFFSEPPRTLQFASGDLLLLVTDGFFEWANAAEELFGNERLERTVRGARDKSAAEIISTLDKDVIHFAGGTSQKDDLTAIVIKRS
jgi:serine phosphatase RsbU (regulator of sigma subunit)